MAGAVCNPFYTAALSDALAGGTPPGYKLRLYSNNVTPVKGSVPGDFTESTASGYAAVALSTGNWTVATVSTVVKATYILVTFTLTGSGTIYGYYVTDTAGANVMWGELASGGPFVFGSGGGTVQVVLELDGP